MSVQVISGLVRRPRADPSVPLQHEAGKVRQINPSGKSILIFRNRVKPRNQKYFAGHVGQISGTSPAILGPHEGRFAIVTMRWAEDVMDASASGERLSSPDENVEAYGQVVWSWRRDAGAKPVGCFRR
jgi:hypothetical protein